MRKILLISLFTPFLFLAGCGTSTNSLTLAKIQAETASITAGINAANSIAQSSTVLTVAQKALAQQATVTADSAEKVVATLTTKRAFGPGLLAFDQAVEAVMPTLNAVWAVNPGTAAAIELGLGLKDAFIGGVSTPATETLNLSTPAAPVPVPLPVNRI